MELLPAVQVLSALAHETRLRVFRTLVQAGAPMGSGALAEVLEVPPQTMSFHLKELRRVGLVEAERKGRSIEYVPVFATLQALSSYLMEDCCKGICHD